VPEIDLVQANQTFMPSFPADYGEGSNLVTITNEPYISDLPIVADDLDNTSIFQDIELPEGPPITVNLNQSYPSDNYSPTPQYGFDEAVVDVYDFITSGNTGNANSGIVQAVAQPATTSGYAGNIIVNPYTIDMSPSEIAYQDAIANPVVQPIVETPIVDTGSDLTTLMQKMSGGIDGEVDYAPGSTDAIDSIVANKLLQEQAAAQAQARAQKEAQARAQAEAAARAQAEAEAAAQAREQARARAQAEAAAQAREQARLSEQARARAQAEAAAQAKAQAAAAEKARQAAAAQKRMNDRYETGPVARAPTSAPRPSAPAGGYSTKSVNNNFATRRDIRNIFA
jgi:pyruvate/2-oxoglutarate dehydrogenase complex dihydrolipoamide acyltransferase (E2) component